jgi:hypothetical protein
MQANEREVVCRRRPSFDQGAFITNASGVQNRERAITMNLHAWEWTRKLVDRNVCVCACGVDGRHISFSDRIRPTVYNYTF